MVKMVRDRMLFDEDSAVVRYRWEPGGQRSSQGGQLLALSPASIATCERAVDVTNWIRRKTNGWLDLQGGNWLFGAEFALMFVSLFALKIVFALAVTADTYLHSATVTWIPLSVVAGMNLLITLPWGLYLHFLGNKAVKESPPVRFNRQRREVAIPCRTEVRPVKLPLWNESVAGWACILLAFTIAAVLYTPLGLEGDPSEHVKKVQLYLVFALCVEVLVVGGYLLVAIPLKKKHAPELVYEFYPWEKLVAFIETQQNIGPNLMATHTFLTLAIPRSDDPETALASARINVGHETVGLAQWECIRRFMEDGPDACPDPKADDTLAGYKAKCRQARQELPLLPWLWKKVGDWFFQRYLAHVITERRIKTLALRSLPEELKAWSEPLPESQWAKPSETLKALNEQLTQDRK